MSFDLFLTKKRVSREEFTAYFQNQANYGVAGDQALYQNEDTGVYFSFTFQESEEAGEEGQDSSIAFNLNYFRPTCFALEAEPEVARAIDSFGCGVFDPQNEGMGEGPYSRDGFLASWNAGNEFGYRAALEGEGAPDRIYARPGEEIHALWRWNFRKKEVLRSIGKDIFVPRILYVDSGDRLMSVAVWPDALSTLIPKVDALYIPRKDRAPRKLFGRKEDFCLVAFDEARALLEPYKTDAYGLEAYELPSPDTPDELKAYVESLRPFVGKVEGVGIDNVLNLELVEKRAKKTRIVC